jgi:hypothetical protein
METEHTSATPSEVAALLQAGKLPEARQALCRFQTQSTAAALALDTVSELAEPSETPGFPRWKQTPDYESALETVRRCLAGGV